MCDLTEPEMEPQTFRADKDVFNRYANWPFSRLKTFKRLTDDGIISDDCDTGNIVIEFNKC